MLQNQHRSESSSIFELAWVVTLVQLISLSWFWWLCVAKVSFLQNLRTERLWFCTRFVEMIVADTLHHSVGFWCRCFKNSDTDFKKKKERKTSLVNWHAHQPSDRTRRSKIEAVKMSRNIRIRGICKESGSHMKPISEKVPGCQVTHSSSVAAATSSWYEWRVVDICWTCSPISESQTMLPQFGFQAFACWQRSACNYFEWKRWWWSVCEWGAVGELLGRGAEEECVCLENEALQFIHSLAGKMGEVYEFSLYHWSQCPQQRKGNTSHTSSCSVTNTPYQSM